MSAPRRCISSACWKRFSKIVSVIVPTPSATQFTAITCACMSVGNPGCGIVWKFTLLPGDGRGLPFERDVGAEALHLERVLEAVLENRLGDREPLPARARD